MKHKIICLTCDQVMPEYGGQWHLPGCPDVGVVASNWVKRDGEWYLRGTDKMYPRMRMR
jgi:hypothetical protein